MDELEKIIDDLDEELQYCANIVIKSGNKIRLLPLLRQYIHKNITKSELKYEIHKFTNLIYFS